MKGQRRLILLVTASALLFPVMCKSVNGSTLSPGEILYSDSGNGLEGGAIFKCNSAGGDLAVVSSGGYLTMPFDIAISSQGELIVSDSGRLIGVDPTTGHQRVISGAQPGSLGFTCGLACERNGTVLVANAESILRVDLTNGRARVLSSGGQFLYPIGITINSRGELFVLNMDFPAEILKVNPSNGNQTLISRGQYLNCPQAIAVRGSDLYVTDVAEPGLNFGTGRVIRVNIQTGAQDVLAEGRLLVGPVGIAVDENGDLIVADPYTVNPDSLPVAGEYDGALIRIDPVTRDQFLLARGHGGYVNPRGVEVVTVVAGTRKSSGGAGNGGGKK